MNLNFIKPEFDFIILDKDNNPLYRIANAKLYRGGNTLSAQEMNPAMTVVRKELEDYNEYEIKFDGESILRVLLKGRTLLQFNLKADSVIISRRLPPTGGMLLSFVSGDRYELIASIKYKDQFTNKKSLRLNPSEHVEVIQLIAHLILNAPE